MIIKLSIIFDNKLVINKFSLINENNKIRIKSVDILDKIIKIPVYNKYNGLNYIPLKFPLEMPIYSKKVFNPYIILSSYNLKMDNDLDFFYNIEKVLQTKYNLILFTFDNLLEDNNLFIKIMNENYTSNINMEFPNINNNYSPDYLYNYNTETDNLNKGEYELLKIINTLWFNVNIIELYIIYILVKFPNISNKIIKEINQQYKIPKKILILANNIKLSKYDLFSLNNNDNNMTFLNYISINFNLPLKLTEIKQNNNYYISKKINDDILITNSSQDILNKIVKINVKKINKNIVCLNEYQNIVFDNYKWYYYNPLIKIDNDYIIYQSFINHSLKNDIIKYILNLSDIHTNKILDYYYNNRKISNLISLGTIFDNIKSYFDDLEIIKTNCFSDVYFEYITKKYHNNEKIYEIFEILFNNYNYPLKLNRQNLDNTFDYIIYLSLNNINIIFSNSNSPNILNQKILNMLPIKLRNLYINLIKTINQLIAGDFESITYNQKFYYDYLHKNIIKLFFTDLDKLSIKYFRNNITEQNYKKIIKIISTNLLLIDISNKLSWSNLPKKLNYLNYYYKNNDVVFFQDKLNKNIIPENFDLRIKKVIENPFEMYRYLRKENDFIKWTKYISDKIIQMYYIPISLSSDDLSHIGKLIYLLFNITEQNLKEISYNNFINFCNLHNKLILDSNRINIKIRELFPSLKTNINLGFLAKHLTWNKEIITFDDNINKSQEVILLEIKLQEATKKYYKYKAKYLESKDINIDTITKNENGYILNKVSDTSSYVNI